MRRRKTQSSKKIAKQHMESLFKQAKDVFKKNKSLANRYVTLARKVAMKFKLRIPSEYKRQFCKHCYKYLMPGTNCRVRTTEGRIVYYCLECKKYSRFPFYRERKARRSKHVKEKK